MYAAPYVRYVNNMDEAPARRTFFKTQKNGSVA